MRELRKIASGLGVSRPIFKLTISSDGDRVALGESLYPYTVDEDSENIEERLVADAYRENFESNLGRFTVDRESVAKTAMHRVRRHIAQFIEKNLGMRNSAQSKLYKWAIREMPETEEYNNILLSLYKYMCTFCNANMTHGGLAGSGKHIASTLALLEAMMEKSK